MPEGKEADRIGKNSEHPNLNTGRRKGVPNKVTKNCREHFQLLLDGNMPKLQACFEALADEEKQQYNPKAFIDAHLSLAEYVLPKLARTEIVSEDQNKMVIEIRKVGYDNNDSSSS